MAAFIFLGMILSACTNDKPDIGQSAESVTSFEERVRPAIKGGTSAAYFTYVNSLDVPDTLKAVRSSVAGMAQLHESYETEDGMMGMREQKELIVSPGDSIRFRQGGLHIMLMQLTQDLNNGDSVRLEVEFARAGLFSIELPVKSES